MDQWAILSVSDKTGLTELAQGFLSQGIKLIASGGTYRFLRNEGIDVAPLEDLTGFSEILGGRVKTLHPRIYAGILSRETPEDERDRESIGAPMIVAVVVNLYAFETRLQEGASQEQLVEEIDIGGVALIRAAAKNYARTLVLVDPRQYHEALQTPLAEMSPSERLKRAQEAFLHIAHYDAVIADALSQWTDPAVRPVTQDVFVVSGRRWGELRYGENPHQQAAFYASPGQRGFQSATLHQGKALSYNNLADADTAWRLSASLPAPNAVAIKHQTPCGVGLGRTLEEAYQKAYEADPVSIFGGIVAVKGTVGEALARQLTSIFLEVVIAEEYTDQALGILAKKKNLRVLAMPFQLPLYAEEIRTITGGFLVQQRDNVTLSWDSLTHVGGPKADLAMWKTDLTLAWTTVGFVKSNAIVVVKDGMTVGIGGGQTNRIDAAHQALEQAKDRAVGAVLASDAFFPFGDVMKEAAQYGVGVVIQPGGSVRDNESIEQANLHGIPLYFTGERHFRH
ncbi:MAG: bifunctional phosphoribosylaminoimidazolecarboxamide formyltransferase/IMP cyclohydrolase [Firmicutes bacterium]|jgi:phosphoribosylaminoimidazolecarboxamide formyltransferase/IMP cyclohydrolase|uniref:Bifunctional purine biosynthesis protein PurH n=1 Tax=Sulfobacillus benefaciens TaxID=453960 RepID=A0A2T2X1D3_9FIRM|nr:bifunctional phosphoribosylaminoimidazolecarboxamide formyltransferase/IMP cyclohydrolase [Bacillota bacterium]MCL5015275.1 bifunctional phosphoribosylaminoimidazolecarboxamide formyltransferase/IMP cyclohydrolase [Bacillota bacterium]PSR28295.1 MAG: bifunctional phosphoribosylaminoimidazolecarboxamide formyltransferase/IMP cyclohydrolase PurH [Sulfobacillus benefaciens]